jgi:hypothetical protein
MSAVSGRTLFTPASGANGSGQCARPSATALA